MMDFRKLGACVALDMVGLKEAADILDVPSLKTTPDKMMNKWRDKALTSKAGDEDLFKGLKQKTLGPEPFEMPKLGGIPIEPDRGEDRETYQRRTETLTPHTNAKTAPSADINMRGSDTNTLIGTVWADHDSLRSVPEQEWPSKSG
jgi:hypothetical protein